MSPHTLPTLLIALALTSAASALDWNPRHLVCPRAEGPVVVDGRLDDPAWGEIDDGAWITEFVDIEGENRPLEPRFATRARLCWDDHALYIAGELADTHVWGTHTERDAVIFEDNDFEVFLDPDGDHHLYAELEVNALNTVWDLLLVRPYRDGGPALDGWTITGLETAVRVDSTLNDPSDTDRGWTVEIAIPWAALREIAGDRACPPEPGDTWRLNLSRVQWEHRIEAGRYVKTPIAGRGWKGEDNWVWSPQGEVAMHLPEMWGLVTFTEMGDDLVVDPREVLRPVYEALLPLDRAQRAHHAEHGKYAARLAELETLPEAVHGHLARADLELEGGGDQWLARLRLGDSVWTWNHEGRLTRE
jgi:hypothetical protein